MSEKLEAYKGLTNEEIIMIYYRFDKYLTGLKTNLDKNMISKNVDTPFGNGIALISVPEEHVEQFRQTQYYGLLNSIVEKLKPIVNLIEECDPTMKELAEEVK
jgi:glutathione synthase/RimK-type ligase-like ATP-grasp enzyme